MTDTKPIRRIAIIGTGVIGASWTSLFLARGLQVVATDVAPNAEAALRKFVETAWPALRRLGLSPEASQSNLRFRSEEHTSELQSLIDLVCRLLLEIDPLGPVLLDEVGVRDRLRERGREPQVRLGRPRREA